MIILLGRKLVGNEMMSLWKALNSSKFLCQRNRIFAANLIHSNQWFVWLRTFRSVSSCQINRTRSHIDTKTDDTVAGGRKEVGIQTINKRIKDSENADVFGLLVDGDRHYNLKKLSQEKGEHKARDFSASKKPFVTRGRNSSTDSWPSVFGTIEEEDLQESDDERFTDDDQEIDESENPYRRLDSVGRKHYPDWYGRRIAKFGRAGKVFESIQVLEEEMLKQDRVRPNQYVFTVLIGVLGRHGYTKKAFKIFNKMKKFGLAPQDPTYTALFNACSNSPWPEDGLQRASGLRRLMAEKDHQPNLMTYNAMVKAFAKCGDLQTAFSIVDEAIAAGHWPDAYCYSSLLIACVSDKEAGLKHAIEVWRIMRKRKVTPGTYHYNLLLRIVRDCGLGDESFMRQLIRRDKASSMISGHLQPCHRDVRLNSRDRYKLQSNQQHCDETELTRSVHHDTDTQDNQSNTVEFIPAQQSSSAIQKFESPADVSCASESAANVAHSASVFDMEVPNLLNPRAQFGSLVSLDMPRSPAERLALLGGLPGILSHMTKDGAEPDIKTFTILLETVSSLPEMESDLLAAMTLNKIKPDVDFCSLLIRKRNLRKDYDGAKDVLRLMERFDLKPDVRTFGCLAMGCSRKENAIQLFAEMKNVDLVPNTEIFDILVYQSNWDFNYKRYLLFAMKSYNVLPNENLIKKLEARISLARTLIVKKERGELVPDFCNDEKFDKNFQKFMLFYKSWLLSTDLEPNVHPWARFVQPVPVIQANEDKDASPLAKKKLK